MGKVYKVTVEAEIVGNPFCVDVLNLLNDMEYFLYSKNDYIVEVDKTILLLNEHGETFEIEEVNIEQGKRFKIKSNIAAEITLKEQDINITDYLNCQGFIPKELSDRDFHIIESNIISIEDFEGKEE